MIGKTRAELVAGGTDSEWTLRQPLTVPAGTVLLLADLAVVVKRARTIDGRAQLSVAPAELDDVFTKVELRELVELDHASFEAASADGKLRSEPSHDKAIGGRLDASKRVAISFNEGPFSGELSFGLRGRLSFDWDASDGSGAHGSLDVIGDVRSVLQAVASKAKTYALPERRIGVLRIPIPLSIVDKAFTVVGVRTAAIDIPISIGAELMTQFDMNLRLDGKAETGAVVSYTREDGLQVDGPSYGAAFTVTGQLSSSGPKPFASAGVRVGPYVHARPQLLILNQVASIGADLKIGMYAHGTASLLNDEPYYCLSLQPELTAAVFGFFKAVGVPQRSSKAKEGRFPVGGSYERGKCGDAGVAADAETNTDDSADASDDMDPGESSDDDVVEDAGDVMDASRSEEGQRATEGTDAEPAVTRSSDAGRDAGATRDAGESQAQRCEAACAYRTDVLGCAGNPNTCAALCLAFRTVASQQGKCSQLALALEECRYSRDALSLGCTVSDSVIDMHLCVSQATALDACETQRDCPTGSTCK